MPAQRPVTAEDPSDPKVLAALVGRSIQTAELAMREAAAGRRVAEDIRDHLRQAGNATTWLYQMPRWRLVAALALIGAIGGLAGGAALVAAAHLERPAVAAPPR